MDANRYATKKTIAQGMLDVALLTANASQLKYVLQLGENVHPFYHLMLALIIVSIVLQVLILNLFYIFGQDSQCLLASSLYLAWTSISVNHDDDTMTSNSCHICSTLPK